jgi:DNA invertase Pin-like site-specific DNA recombinase
MKGAPVQPTPSYPAHVTRSTLRMIGYVWNSTDEQLAGLKAQDGLIRAAAARRPDWELVAIERERSSGSGVVRPVLAQLLARVRCRDADGLIVARLDRLARSLSHLSALLDDARTRPWVFVALDVAVDLSTPRGEMVAGAMAMAAQFQRRVIGQSTRDALEVKRAQGVRLGRPRRCPDEVLTRVVTYRATGARLIDICEQLNTDGVPTPAGSPRWYPSHVSRLLRTQDALQLAAVG